MMFDLNIVHTFKHIKMINKLKFIFHLYSLVTKRFITLDAMLDTIIRLIQIGISSFILRNSTIYRLQIKYG